MMSSAALADAGLTKIIEEATGIAQAYLRGSYGEEFAGWGSSPPTEIREAVMTLAACGVVQAMPAGSAYDAYCGEPVDQARQFLRDIAKGVAVLDIPDSPLEERAKAQVAFRDRTPVFGPRGPTKGW
jgi:hypothetical protein